MYIISVSDETLVRFKLKTGAVLGDDLLEQIRSEDHYQYAKELAAGYLSYAPRTRSQVERYLREKEVDEGAAERALGLMEEYGYIDDLAYAKEFARQQSAKYGSRAIAYKLAQKGIPAETARQALEELPPESETAQKLMEKLKQKYAGLDPAKKKQRIYAAMIRKGFAYSDFSAMMDYLDDGEG